MLLQRIELKGFLSYYGQENETGRLEPIVIDFRQSSLWLIHGKNGTGKTSLFDAISFALYGLHRGSGTRNNQANYLVHHQAYKDKAEINLEIEIEGQSYLIQRTITRTRRKVKGQYKEGSKLWGIVRCGSSINSPAIPNTENAVTEWVEKHLKMKDETFLSSVLLRQGEADAFLKTKSSARRERLLEVLDLEFYKKLGDRATQKYNEYKKDRSKIQQEIEQLTVITENEIKTQKQLITEKYQSLKQIKQNQNDKLKEKENAKQAIEYQQQISSKQEQQEQYQHLIERQESILEDAQLYRKIDNGIKQLDMLWEKRKRLTKEENSLQKTQKNLEKLQTELENLNIELEQAKKQEKNKIEEFTLINQRLDQLKENQNDLSHQVKDLEQVERLERQIKQAEEQLKPHIEILKHSQEIEANSERHQELNTGVTLLQKLNEAQQELRESESKFSESEKIVNTCKEQVEIATNDRDELIKNKDSLQKKIEEIEKKLQHCQNQISILKQKLEHRETVSHAQECPTCGSHLDNPEAQIRLQQECQSWREQLIKLELEKKEIKTKLDLGKKSKSEVENNLVQLNQNHRNLEIELTQLKTNQDNWQKIVKQKQKAVDIACDKAGIWSEYLEQLSSLEIELASLQAIPNQKKKLDNAKLIQNPVAHNLKHCRSELAKLPEFTDKQRQELKPERDRITQDISECQKQKETLEPEAQKAQSLCKELTNQKTIKETQIYSEDSKKKDLTIRQQQAKQEVEKCKNALFFDWKNHPACENQEALKKLRQDLTDLSGAEAKEKELQEAQRYLSEITGEIKTFQELLFKIPVEHRRPIAEIENELEEIGSNFKQTERQLKTEELTLRQKQSQKQQYEQKQKKLDEVSREVNYYKNLADTFGAKELQAKIIQEAQEKIKLNANNTLARLSDGRWQIDLEENDSQTELNIVARDLNQLGTPAQQFEYLSSGEKFIVAVSLAVAIGQSIYGGRTVDSLVIDEGFGNLDDEKRPLMVKELKRLSEEILQGGRVIIVSHQNDVCEGFDSRYYVYRDDNHYAQVEQYLSVPI